MNDPVLLLFRGRGIISSLIRWQTRSVYSHAAFLLPTGEVLESWQGKGVRLARLESTEGVDTFAIPSMSSLQWQQAIGFATTCLGKKYDYWAVVRFVSRRRMPGNDRWFCSELVFASLCFAGVDLLLRIAPSEVSPGLLSLSPLLQPVTNPL